MGRQYMDFLNDFTPAVPVTPEVELKAWAYVTRTEEHCQDLWNYLFAPPDGHKDSFDSAGKRRGGRKK